MPSEKSQQGSFSVFKSGVVLKNSNNNSAPPPPNFNEIICFGEDSRDFKEIIYNSKIRSTLNFTVEVLTNDSPTTRLAARNRKPGMKKRIPRPQNAFMIYRRNKFASLEFAGVKSSVASTEIAKMWKQEDCEVQLYFSALAILASENHAKKYENYQYQPRASKRSHRKKPNQHEKIENIENIENISPEIMITSPEMTAYQDFIMFEEIIQPQVSVTPPSPSSSTDGYLPTPETLSPIYEYISTLSTPVSSSPIINEYLPTPTSSVECFLNELNLGQLVGQAFPPLNDINTSPSNPLLDDSQSKFLLEAELLSNTATNVPELQLDVQLDSYYFNLDFNPFQPICELPMDAPLESTIIPTTNNSLFLDPSEWKINDDSTLYSDQMDHVYGYDTVNGRPSL